MAGKKTKSAKSNSRPSVIDPRLKALFVWIAGPGRATVLAVAIVGAFAGSLFFLWARYRDQILSSEAYWVTPARVDITSPPPWVRSDIRAEVFRDASLDGRLSIMDPDLAERIDNAFSLHPWVAEVVRSRKRHPARVEVELVYRRPVCMVQTREQLLPVDAEGILLPAGDFSPVEASRYPRLEGIRTVPLGTAGTRWGDARVFGGARIAAVLGPVWDELRLERIVPSEATAAGYAEEPTFELHTRGGTRILWGRAPGVDLPGEVPAAEKVARLKRYKQQHGTLEGINGPQKLDVRSLRSMQGAPRTAGKPEGELSR